jgi:Fuc2NAc and GlcNAc transferase
MFLSLILLVMLISWVMTGGMRLYALRHNVLDEPNQRSSHSVPTPRGGGVAIVLSFLLACLISYRLGWISLEHCLCFVGAGGLVALIGFLDDHRHVPARWRLLVHFLSAGWGLYWLGGIPPLKFAGLSFELEWLGALLAAVYLVWLLNLYNFMDGIDGIAGVEAITTCAASILICGLLGNWQAALLPAILAGAVVGFLFWNFPPAKIFMGDAGSGFLGLALGLLSLQMAWLEPELLWSWLILLGVFFVDSGATLVRRFWRGEKVYEAHRSHAYQHATRQMGGHFPVTMAVASINLFWLTPLAVWVALGGVAWLVVPLAYVPLIGLALKYRAGLAE